MGGALIIWIISTIVFFFFLYLVIQSALDKSEMAKNLRRITELLDSRINNTNEVTQEIINELDEECPGCDEKVNHNVHFCPRCGLKLRD